MFFNKRRIYINKSDDELVACIQASDDLALEIIIDRYRRAVFGVSLKYLKQIEEAEDLNQELYAKLGSLIRKHTIANYKGWLFRVVKNECLNLLRKKKYIFSEIDDSSFVIAPELDLENLIDLQLEQLESFLNKLSRIQETCIRGFYLENKSYKDLMDEQNLDSMSVKSAIQNGKRKLKQLLEEAFSRIDSTKS